MRARRRAISTASFCARSAAVAWSASGRSRFRTSASTSRARSTSTETRASFNSARWRRALKRPSPAASSMSARRSAGFDARIASTLPWLMIECIPWPRPRSASSSTRSIRRTAARLTRYCPSPPRCRRRATESSAKSTGSAPSALSKRSSTSQKSAGPRAPPPAKRTSSGFSARSSVGLREPAAQRIASETFDLPEPFGPTITPTPGSRRTSTGSGKDLKPRSLTARRCTARHPKEPTGRYEEGLAERCSSRASGASSSACSSSTKISRIPRGSESSSSSVSRRKRSSELVGFRSVMRAEGCQKLGNVREIELGERLPGRFLLGGLLRPALAATELLAVDDRRACEAAFVRGPLHRDLGVGDVATGPGEQLLQVGLVVDARGERVLDLVGEGVDDGVPDGGEAVLEEDRAERRLDHRREHVAVAREPFELLLRLGGSRVRDETLPEAELARHHRARRTR